MGTKNNPGKYDCYAKAEPDEPMFVLLARDRHAPAIVWLWAVLRNLDGEEQSVTQEAVQCAADMMAWGHERDRRFAGFGQATIAGLLELIKVANLSAEKALNDPTTDNVMLVRAALAQTMLGVASRDPGKT